MIELFMQFVNNILPSVITFIVGCGVIYFLKGLNLLASNTRVMSVMNSIASNEQLRLIAKNLCIYAQKYVSSVAMDKLKYVVAQVENYCRQSGIKMTKEQVLEIVQTTYDENEKEIKSNKFVQDLEKVFSDGDNESLKNN